MSTTTMRFYNLQFRKHVRFFYDRKHNLRVVTPRKMMQLENLMINQALEKNEGLEGDNWVKIRKDLLDSELSVNNHNIDVAIIERCKAAGNAAAAVNYVEFLISINHKINLGTINEFFDTLYGARRSLSEKEENLVMKLYDDLRAKFPILDPQTAFTCIIGLSMTKRWKEFPELLQMCSSSPVTMSRIHGIIASAAFSYDDPDAGWKHIELMGLSDTLPLRLWNSYFNYSIRHSNNTKDIESHFDKMFEVCSEHNIYPDFELIKMYGDHLKKTGEWQYNKTNIDSKGSCAVCGQRLTNLEITLEEFELLKATFFSNVVVGDDLYYNTTPEELAHFKKFVESTKPYDVVIDGLNVSYTHGSEKANRAQGLIRIIDQLIGQKKKIFILGRKHMNKWKKHEMDYVRRNSYLYLANNLTNDDLFLLHATFASGPNAYFCSRDLMRQHKFNLKDNKIQRIFRSWQSTRQIMPTTLGGPHNKQLLLVYPTGISNTCQKTPNGDWHLPCRDGSLKEFAPFTWLCLHKRKNSR